MFTYISGESSIIQTCIIAVVSAFEMRVERLGVHVEAAAAAAFSFVSFVKFTVRLGVPADYSNITSVALEYMHFF